MEIDEEDYLAHYGILRKSGRYPWGSGKTQDERNSTFLSMVEKCKQQGMSELEIAKGFDITTAELRNAKTIAKTSQKQARILMAQSLKDKGWSNVAAAKRMGIPEPTYRALLKPGEADKAAVLKATSDILRNAVAEKKYVDIGAGVEHHMAISSTKLKNAVALLQEEGYTVHYVQVEQLGTGNKTTVKVLAGPDTPKSEVYKNQDKISPVMGYSDDGGRTYDRILPPLSVSSKRVAIRYADQGGSATDGVIYVRPGVKDVSLGGSRYAQVRVAVDGSHYLKGMAMYKDDLPDGVDLMFNTNKKDTGTKHDAMKPMSDDPDNPFGATIKRQIQEQGSDGKKKVASAMNIVNEEGDWEKWSRSISSQMLSKQTPTLAKDQLEMVRKRKADELREILALTNPAVRRKLLATYADSADSSSVHLKAAALPSQASHVILPIESMKPTEVYAPNYKDGDRVVLIRYPHGGIFEIPELRVNNRHPEAKKLLGQAKDAIGIHSSVAERLSGADFDGDTVLVIPNNIGKIKTEPALEGLKDFDPMKYKLPDDSPIPRMTPKGKQVEMGKISNLITDMTIKGATNDEKARAVRHSMVVIDGEKHNLNYRQSAIDNGIAQLRKKYQSKPDKKGYGASTLISNSGATSTVKVPERKYGKIDPATGKKTYVETGRAYVHPKTGKVELNTTEVTRLGDAEDAHTLSSGTKIERIYADHSNALKALANEARREMLATKSVPYSSEARVKYKDQVKTLEAKLNLALRNSPLERQSQIIANAIVKQKLDANPDMEPATLKRLKAQELTKARNRTGAKKQLVEITPDEWTAIQSGAITNHMLTQILDNADLDTVKQLATPKDRPVLSESRKSSAIAMLRNGYTPAEVAEAMGVPVTILKRSLSEGGHDG